MWLSSIMLIILIGVLSFAVCRAAGQKTLAMFIVLLAVFAVVESTARALQPAADNVKTKYEKVEKTIERIDNILN